MLSNLPPQVTAPSRSSTETPGSTLLSTTLPLSLVFLMALALRLAFNFWLPHANAYSAADAAEYLRNAQALSQMSALPAHFWQDCLTCLVGHGSTQLQQSIKTAFSPLSDFAISGPVFPLFLLSSFAAVGTTFDINNWAVPLAAQSVLTSLSCVFIALTGCHAWSRRVGIMAGALAAIYPAFIVNSGRLYSESFACFLLSMVMWLTVRGFKLKGNGPWLSFLTGFTLAALQLTRSIMFVLSLALFPITYFQHKTNHKRWLSIALIAVGFATVACPWMAWQKLAFGKATLVVDRVGHYNFWTGNHVDTQGWLSFPYPDGRGIETRSFPQLLQESYQSSPSRWLKLQLDKPLRLFKFPWNDFRTPIGLVNMQLQVAIHQLLLLLAAIGISLAIFVSPAKELFHREQLSSRLFLAGLLLFHFIYCLFITVPRYNLTAMPCVILFAAAGLATIWSLRQSSAIILFAIAGSLLWAVTRVDLLAIFHTLPGLQNVELCLYLTSAVKLAVWILLATGFWKLIGKLRGQRQLAYATTLLLFIAAGSSICLPLRAHGRCFEWQTQLKAPGQVISQTIAIDQALANRQCYVLIDSPGASQLESGLEISVNGRILDGPVIPSLSLAGDIGDFKQAGIDNLFLEGEYIFDCMTRPSAISNRDLRQWFLVPVPQEVVQSANASRQLIVTLRQTSKTPKTFFGAYPSSQKQLEIPSLNLYSWEKAFYGVENDAGLTDTRYEIKIARDTAPKLAHHGDYNLRLLAAPPVKSANMRLLQQSPLPIHSRQHQLASLPTPAARDLWLIRIRGKLRSLQAQTDCLLQLTASGHTVSQSQFTYTSPWTPRNIVCDHNWSTLDVTLPLQVGSLPGKLDTINVNLSSTGIQSKDTSISIFALPANPISPGCRIY